MIPAAIAFLGGELRAQTVRVQRIDSKVEVAPVGKPGQFSTGQPADIMLSGVGFNNTGGPLLFNHPSGLAVTGHDSWNWPDSQTREILSRDHQDLKIEPRIERKTGHSGRYRANRRGRAPIVPG